MVSKARTPDKAIGSRRKGDAGSRMRVVSKEPIHEQILPHIRRDIVLNRWAPDERLPEMELCEEFGVSRTPLRDVLKILEVEGLVTLLPHVGAIVTPLDPPDLAEKLEVMSGLEQMSAMKVAELQPSAAIREIERLHKAMAVAAKNGQISKYYALNDEFHRAIVLGCNNNTLAKMHETVMWHVSRARNYANERETLTKSAAEHHDAIVDRIIAGDADGSARAMREHLKEVINTVLARLSREPGSHAVSTMKNSAA
ncbi:transcriptional regulator, GntR family [Rhizobium sp. CF080]|uniref:GntR family transcriptional regulator n=1 Tax=Rhizobium sp. (strain CF080) TaxID=1144310 RepID=UPI000271CE3D|nr:GntR family transcriptional regulator [Rhizobium sp. CF080]EUB99897.1 transcriptional regulator, GntR family [Rhizobium sp. CF080]